MLEFLNSHSSALNVIANLVMAIIWLSYFHLLLMSFRRQRKSSLVISCTTSKHNRPECLIANMSEGRFYVQNIIGATTTSDKKLSADLTEPVSDELEHSLQGPMGPGDKLIAGPFGQLLDRLVKAHPEAETDAFNDAERIDFELTVIGVHGTDSKSVAAQRTFCLERKEQGGFAAMTVNRTTRQVRHGRKRRDIVSQAANVR